MYTSDDELYDVHTTDEQCEEEIGLYMNRDTEPDYTCPLCFRQWKVKWDYVYSNLSNGYLTIVEAKLVE